jgi:glycosyltransferase involved in cell wall biosynthesis
MHLIGLGLKKTFPQLTWVADFRDPWAKFDYLPEWQTGERAMEKHRSLEKKVLDTANLVIMVTPSIHEEFQSFDYRRKVMITNGFDEEDFHKTPAEIERDGYFKIYHTGLLSGLRNPSSLWQAFEETCKTDPAFAEKFRLILVGQVDDTVKESIRKHPFLSERTQYIAWLPHSEVIKENAKADAMLLIINQSFNAKTQLTGKLFEYLALGKPVLALCPTDGDAAAIVRDTGIGYPIDFEDINGIKKALATLFVQYSKNENLRIDPKKILRYSRKQLTAQLVEALENQIFSPEIAKN